MVVARPFTLVPAPVTVDEGLVVEVDRWLNLMQLALDGLRYRPEGSAPGDLEDIGLLAQEARSRVVALRLAEG